MPDGRPGRLRQADGLALAGNLQVPATTASADIRQSISGGCL